MGAVQYQGVRKGGKEGLYHLAGISITHFLHQPGFFFLFWRRISMQFIFVFIPHHCHLEPGIRIFISMSVVYISELSKKRTGITGEAGGLYERTTLASEKDECK